MFECSFDANPVMYDGIRWAKMAKANDEEVSLSPAASSRISIDWDDNGGNRVTSRLIIRNVAVQDAGKIFCLVSMNRRVITMMFYTPTHALKISKHLSSDC